jgi:hypothetical protein
MKSRLLSGVIFLTYILGLTTIGLANPKLASAQPTFNCEWVPMAPTEKCRTRIDACPSGYDTGTSCFSYTTETTCRAAGPFPCIAASIGEPFKPQECPCDPRWESCDYPPIRTAIGCIPTQPLEFIGQFRDILIGIGGGIAFLLMIIGSAFILTSQGNPERIKHGKEIFVGALVGLLIMIFSVFILQLIGVDILGLFR